ncbi:hypothetical protein CD30_19600 [Ureibacillus massiliensis 4400831 = CIP 108448 = CCUG 49529]|uniref:Preprotein translocase subunit SecB n=1 Tax=Ureibacillus massiliensis 4400831 = CIP 108448 = CCUG 49529 TaxID=1211035 RepID=A0A0A3I776_9BACL|nr:protein-export chaperone SecB [Ureibacillus massiliensis]KGR80631.1 hypothetical protein CD30_19600 [Ureibacillus massiliensis 4400831 = CIP 108448 = CCUG 49529]
MNNKTLEYYKLIRNSVQFIDVELLKLDCEKRTEELGDGRGVSLSLGRDVLNVKDNEAELILNVELIGPNDIFKIDLTYKGLCRNMNSDISKAQFEQYAYDQIVPLLLPYARECISNTLMRMKLPIFLLPTIDVLDTLEVNATNE